jgi:hypothetical protein
MSRKSFEINQEKESNKDAKRRNRLTDNRKRGGLVASMPPKHAHKMGEIFLRYDVVHCLRQRLGD